MSFQIPQSFAEWCQLFPALFTFILGLAWLLAPRTMLATVGLEGMATHPEAVGEGRSSFAGPLLGSAVVAALFQQPVFQTLLGLQWGAVAIGLAIMLYMQHARDKRLIIQFVIAVIIAAFAFGSSGGGIFSLDFSEAFAPLIPDTFTLVFPQSGEEWLPIISGAVSFGFGILCILRPEAALLMMRLQTKAKESQSRSISSGVVRAMPGGFYLALGGLILVYCFVPYTEMFKAMMFMTLGMCWGAVAFGRMIAMLCDRAANLYNWVSLLLELVLSAMPILVVFGLLS